MRSFCLSLLSAGTAGMLWWDTMNRKKVREKRVHSAYTSTSLFIIERNRIGTQRTRRQELMRRPWGMLLTDLLIAAFSACLLIESKTTSPGMVLFTVSWALLHLSRRKYPTQLPMAQSYGSLFLIKAPSSQNKIIQQEPPHLLLTFPLSCVALFSNKISWFQILFLGT